MKGESFEGEWCGAEHFRFFTPVREEVTSKTCFVNVLSSHKSTHLPWGSGEVYACGRSA
jgi:hypothetical protein